MANKGKKGKAKDLPEYVRIGAHKIPIKMQKGLFDSEAYGIFDPDKLEIKIENDMSPGLQRETLLHEVVEAINFLCELDLEHQAIQVLGLMLHQVTESIQEQS